jgi:cytochrome b subunit of formate dehydrogenase
MMKRNKAKINYVVDLIIAVGFILSLFSGIVLLFASQGGYMGGRNPEFSRQLLFFERPVLKELHNWSSIIMALGVLGHLVLHWNWIVCMTKSIFRRKAKGQDCPA